MKKIFLLLVTILFVSSCGREVHQNATTPGTISPSDEIQITPSPQDNKSEIPASLETKASGMTAVSSVDYSIFDGDSMETITLYTSAQKENGRYHWDDHAKWLLEISSDSGNYYQLYDVDISNGSVYFDLLGVNEDLYILVKNISTASNYTRIFIIENGKVFETNDLDLNTMQGETINMIYTSTPQYR